MTARRLLLGLVLLGTALLLQTTLLNRLPLPGAAPDLLLLVVVATALTEGPLSGTVTGFAGGLLADLGADHELGRAALVYTLVGYLAGLVHDDGARSRLLPLGVVAGCSGVAVIVYAAEGLLLGDPRITTSAIGPALGGTVAYSVVLTPLVVPVVGALLRRLDDDPLGW